MIIVGRCRIPIIKSIPSSTCWFSFINIQKRRYVETKLAAKKEFEPEDIDNFQLEMNQYLTEHPNVDLQDLLSKMRSMEMDNQTIFYNIILKLLRKRKQIKLGVEIIRTMRNKKIPLNVSSHIKMLNLLIESGEISKAIQYFNLVEQKDRDNLKTDTYNVIMGAIFKHAKKKEYFEYLEYLFDNLLTNKSNCKPDHNSYNIMLDYFTKIKDIDSLVFYVDRMKQERIISNKYLYSYNVILQHYSKVKDFGNVQFFLDKMKKNDVPPDKFSYTVVIKSLLTTNKVHVLNQIVQITLIEDIKLANALYYKINEYYFKNGYFKVAFKFFEKLRENKSPLDVIMYSNFIQLSFFKKQYDLLMIFYEFSITDDIQLPIRVNIIVLKSFLLQNRLEDAMKLFDKLRNSNEEKLDLFAYSILLDYLIPDHPDEAQKVIKCMQEDNIKPNLKLQKLLENYSELNVQNKSKN